MNIQKLKEDLEKADNMIETNIKGSVLAIKEAFAYLDYLKENNATVDQIQEQQRIIADLLKNAGDYIKK